MVARFSDGPRYDAETVGRVRAAADGLADEAVDLATADEAERMRLSREYEAAAELWVRRRAADSIVRLIAAAVPAWQAYVGARTAMDVEFAALWETEDSRWRSQVLRLVRAQDEALAAAGRGITPRAG